MKKMIVVLALLLPLIMKAQQYSSLTGLIHVPSADMAPTGEARIGSHFLNREMMPRQSASRTASSLAMGAYHTGNVYLGITPFSWIELGYTMTLLKGTKVPGSDLTDIAYRHKDRYFSVKIRPIKEDRWWPSVAFGANDPMTTSTNNENQYFGNYFVAASKHFDFHSHIVGTHLTYRHWVRDFNGRWNGVVGGITYQPSFQQQLRLIAEYTGDGVNVGFDWKLWKHVLVQASLQDGRYFSGGLCLCLNLL